MSKPIDGRTHEVRTADRDQVRLEPSRVQTQGCTQEEEGYERQQVAQLQSRPFPPGQYKEHSGKSAHSALAEQGENEKHERQSVPLPLEDAWMFRLRISIQRLETEIEPKGRQSEQAGKRVLLLGDPRDRFDLDRMQGEKHRGEPASRNTDPAENQPDQHGIAGVQ